MVNTDLVPRPARVGEAARLVALRDDLAAWMLHRGIQQWQPGEVSVSWMGACIDRREVFVVEDAGVVIGSVRVVWHDNFIWGEKPADAGYVHALMVARDYARAGIGRQLLSWAEDNIRQQGRSFARLDCVRTNERLHHYYLNAGYRQVGYKDFSDVEMSKRPGAVVRATVLFEKRLDRPANG